MAIELWAAVDGDGDGFVYNEEPTWNPESDMFSAEGGFLRGKIALLACKDLSAGQKALVTHVDLQLEEVHVSVPSIPVKDITQSMHDFLNGKIKFSEFDKTYRKLTAQ